MTVGDRLKEIRKNFGLTQAEFGEKMGLKPTAIGQMEKGTRNIVDRTLILLQEKYNVNIDYLQHGTLPMLVKPTTFSLDEYAKRKELGENEIALIREFMNLDPAVRSALYEMFENAFKSDAWKDPETEEDLLKEFPPVTDEKNSGAV